jgi:hypothetical protein
MSGSASNRFDPEPVRGRSDDEALRIAQCYPFRIPGHSFTFVDGAMRPFDREAAAREGRVPVIACGSNRSPEQLARKYGTAPGTVIPVERAWLRDFDVVYVAHITSYGSVAATVQHVPGMSVEVSVTWLDPEQLARMHATESLGHHYHYARLDRLELARESGGGLEHAFAYVTILGALAHEGEAAGLAEVAAEQRPHAGLTQAEVQDAIFARLGAGQSRREFILENVRDRETRRARERALAADALPFAWPHLTVIEA